MIFENWFRLMHGVESYASAATSSPYSVDIGLYDTEGNKLNPTLKPYATTVNGYNGGTPFIVNDQRLGDGTWNPYVSSNPPALLTGDDTYNGTENSLLNEITGNFKMMGKPMIVSTIENGNYRAVQSFQYINNTNTSQTITKFGWYKAVTRDSADVVKKITAFIQDLDTPVIVAPGEIIVIRYNVNPTYNQTNSKLFDNYCKLQYLIRGFSVAKSSAATESYGIKDTSGNDVSALIYPSPSVNVELNTVNTLYRGDQNYKIILGTGDNTYDGTEYCLANDISSNFTNLAYNADLTFDTNGLYREYTVTGTNSSGSDQVITELGFVKKVPYNTSGATNDVLYAVTKLDSPVTVPNGSSFTGTFNWDWTN